MIEQGPQSDNQDDPDIEFEYSDPNSKDKIFELAAACGMTPEEYIYAQIDAMIEDKFIAEAEQDAEDLSLSIAEQGGINLPYLPHEAILFDLRTDDGWLVIDNIDKEGIPLVFDPKDLKNFLIIDEDDDPEVFDPDH